MVDRVAVFVDYQNLHGCARRAFLPYGAGDSDGHIYPAKLGQLIVDRRNRPSELHQVRVYRGRPNPERQPGATRANDRQTSDWERSSVVKVIRRNVSYPHDWPERRAIEKGIDVAIAVDMIHLSMSNEIDAAVLFSSDNDLLPALELLREHRLGHVEVAAWAKTNRLRFHGEQMPWCHHLNEGDFDSLRDRFDYSAPD